MRTMNRIARISENIAVFFFLTLGFILLVIGSVIFGVIALAVYMIVYTIERIFECIISLRR